MSCPLNSRNAQHHAFLLQRPGDSLATACAAYRLVSLAPFAGRRPHHESPANDIRCNGFFELVIVLFRGYQSFLLLQAGIFGSRFRLLHLYH